MASVEVIYLSIAVATSDSYDAHVDKRERAAEFVRLLGLELKGRIVSQGWTANAVARSMNRSPAAFNRWLNNRVEIPLGVLCEACETIDVDPSTVVDYAYNRLAVLYGERDGSTYSDEDVAASADETTRLDAQPSVAVHVADQAIEINVTPEVSEPQPRQERDR